VSNGPTVPLGIVITDLDGTLLGSRQQLAEVNRNTLEELGQRGILRVVSTGRSLHSALSVLSEDVPIDYLCHSSGAGILRWRDRQPLRSVNMGYAEAAALAGELARRELCFMLHFAIPDSHYFHVHHGRTPVPDFQRRLERHAAFASALSLPLAGPREMSQALVIEPPSSAAVYVELMGALPGFQVIRATSPLDGASTWIEIFPRGVNKGSAAAWLRESVARPGVQCMAVGNDYNDLDLLQWADHAYVVGNAPAELRARYTAVASNDEGGFSAAVRLALAAP
jgi:hydroxymethylpyrimidine pyrophosphatase-like HAD family hydrolase